MIGATIGAFTAGKVAAFGRWKAIVICNVILDIGVALTLIPNLYVFAIGRFIYGVFLDDAMNGRNIVGIQIESLQLIGRLARSFVIFNKRNQLVQRLWVGFDGCIIHFSAGHILFQEAISLLEKIRLGL